MIADRLHAPAALTLQRFNVFPRLQARPLVGLQYRIEIGMRNGRMLVHHLPDDLPDLRKM